MAVPCDETGAEGRPSKKHPCPDCRYCQWCGDRRCELCKGWLRRDAEEKAPGTKDEKNGPTREDG